MPGIERVAGTFGTLGKAGQPSLAADRIDTVIAAGEHLMCIALMTDVKDNAVARTIEDTMQRHGQFDRAEVGRQMSAVDRDDIDQLFTDLGAQGGQLVPGQRLEVGGRMNSR